MSNRYPYPVCPNCGRKIKKGFYTTHFEGGIQADVATCWDCKTIFFKLVVGMATIKTTNGEYLTWWPIKKGERDED